MPVNVNIIEEIIMKFFITPFNYYKSFIFTVSLLLIVAGSYAHATDTSSWKEAGTKTKSIDHSDWQTILDTYIQQERVQDGKPPINLFSYSTISDQHKQLLTRYLANIQSIDPREYPKKEQFAYWVNLYNALTVDLILENYPIKSITKLGSLLSFGPWDEDAAEVAGEVLSLNDIEHKILRPIWQDPRIHYAVNCASFSCPNLSDKAFTAENSEIQLEQAARDYINHPRGVSFKANKLKLSKIYKWYADDFGNSEQELLEHIAQYAEPELMKHLEGFDGSISYDYDWSLNEPK